MTHLGSGERGRAPEMKTGAPVRSARRGCQRWRFGYFAAAGTTAGFVAGAATGAGAFFASQRSISRTES